MSYTLKFFYILFGEVFKIFSHLSIYSHNLFLNIAYEHIHLTAGTSYSVMSVRVAVQE